MAEIKKIVMVKVVQLDVLFQPSKFGITFLEHPVENCFYK